jgi:transposase
MTCWPPKRGLFKKCFSPFVTSWTAPCASGRSESLPGRTFTDGSIVPYQGTHNNWVENQIRPVALGRSNWLFAGSLRGGKRAAAIMSLIHSARINGHDPYAYLRDVFERLPTQPASRVNELLPHHWKISTSTI